MKGDFIMPNKIFYQVGILLVVTISQVFAEEKLGKLIEFGWDMPDVPFLVKHIDRLEKLPFDGVVIDLGRRNTWSGAKERKIGFAWRFWQKAPISPDLRKRINEDVKLLKQVKKGVFRNSFVQVNAHPGGIDWFDDSAMKNIIENWKLIARAVKQIGVKGIFFDIEWYAKRKGPGYRFCIWKYSTMPNASKYTYQQYKTKVYERAKEIIKAIKTECPKMTIMFTFGNELVVGTSDLPNDRYGLLPAFIDGFLVGCGDGITIVDGYEHAYGFREPGQFEKARKLTLVDCAKMSRFPRLYRKKMHIGYGLFIDRLGNAEWFTSPEDFIRNVYTPDELAYVVQSGLKYGDYVWIYTQKINWWTGSNCPKEYIEALRKAKEGKAKRPQKRKFSLIKKARISGQYTTARQYPLFGEYTYMGNIWRKYQIVVKLPTVWKFKVDPKRIGEKEKWFDPRCEDTRWDEIIVPEWWNCVDEKWKNYYGVGWYRVKFRLPRWAQGKKLLIYFGGVDEVTKVWLNGNFIGEFNIGSAGWNKPFQFEITKFVSFDKPNILTVRVDGGGAYGGIWRSVYIITPINQN